MTKSKSKPAQETTPANPPNETDPTQAAQGSRSVASRTLAFELARLCSHTHCHNIVVLDVSGLSPVTDFFVIATGTSTRQMRSVADDAEELATAKDYAPLSHSGYEGETWIITDFVDVILHLFDQEARQFYDLDNLWGDAKRLTWQDEGAPVKQKV